MMNNIIEQIKELSGPTKAVLVIETDVKMNKKDVATKKIPNPYLGAKKQSTMIVDLAPKYEAAVNEQRVTEGQEANFEAQQRKWGTNLGNGIIDKEGQLYVGFIVVETIETKYSFEGEDIDKGLLKDFIPVAKPSTNQGTETPIIYRSVKLESIKSLEII